MRFKTSGYSLLAGVLTPPALFLTNWGMPAQALDSSNAVRALLLGITFLLPLGIALFRPISPPVYGATIAVTSFAVPFGIGVAAGWGNLGGLAVLLAGAWGLLIGIGVSVLAPLLRVPSLPRWAAPGMVGLALAASLGIGAWRSATKSEQSFAILDRVEEIRCAELAYASAKEDHAFTCNGPDLPGLRDIDWEANLALGRREKYQARMEGHWVYLTCPPSAHPRWVDIVTDSPTNPVVRVTR